MMARLQITMVFCFFISTIPPSLSQLNCTGGATSCGSRPSCCPSGTICNINRGIPACNDLRSLVTSGFDDSGATDARCTDLYLFDCSAIIGVPKRSCCPIGTICYNDGLDSSISCVDAYGTTASSLPPATTNFVHSSTIIKNSNASVEFNPTNAWNSPTAALNCTVGSNLRTTSTVNATISYNYTGLSILIHTVKSPQGGVFSMTLDGVLLKDTVDTYQPDRELCFPAQYPPFAKPPADFFLRSDHSITLTFLGPSPNAPNDTKSAMVQFDSFAIPLFTTTSDGYRISLGAFQFATVVLIVVPSIPWF